MFAYEDTVSDLHDLRMLIPSYSTADCVIRRVDELDLGDEFIDHLTRVYDACTFTPPITWWERYIADNADEIYKAIGLVKKDTLDEYPIIKEIIEVDDMYLDEDDLERLLPTHDWKEIVEAVRAWNDTAPKTIADCITVERDEDGNYIRVEDGINDYFY